jgi:zinc transporter ZupT
MIILILSAVISLSTIFLGLLFMNKAGKRLNMDQLQVLIAVASGFMLSIVFLDLLPENLEHFSLGTHTFFAFTLLGMLLVMVFERYLVPRLKFVERFFPQHSAVLKTIDVHDGHVHMGNHEHHHHQNLDEAENCEISHEHGHLHSHTHPEVLGHGEVCSAIACFMICSFFDGMALSSIQSFNPRLGVMLVIGVVLHLLPEGILSGAMALAGGASLKGAKTALFFIGGSFALGSLIPFVVTGFQEELVAVSSGILIFVTLVQLLPTALKLKYAPLWIGSGVALFIISHQGIRYLYH